MEKKHKSFTVGMKRQRKTSLRVAVSEPKTLISDLAEIPPIELYNPSPKSKTNTQIPKSILPELTVPDLAGKPSKKKAKKASVNIENNEIAQPEDKRKKKNKRGSEVLNDNASTVQTHIKKKRKEKKLVAELQNIKAELGITGAVKPEDEVTSPETGVKSLQKIPVAKVVSKEMNTAETVDKYPILKDNELIARFLKVPMNNNQKGRIRQAIKLSLQGTTTKMFPDIINGKIQAILSSSTDLTDSELRRVRLLYNMLKTSLETPEELEEVTKTPKKKKDKKKEKEEGGNKKETEQNKVKGPKRYVVFLGNLPLNINKEKIMEHFRELNEHIIHIRVPKIAEGKKSAIAYVELSNEPSYELALSKHHSMLGTKRIKVLYTTQQKTKISKADAKAKSAKLIALQKAGKLIGSVPASKKRSHRRAIMKKAKAKEAAPTE